MGCNSCQKRAQRTFQQKVSQGCQGVRERLVKIKKAVYARYRITKDKTFYQDYLIISKKIRDRECTEQHVLEAYELEYLK